MRAVLLLALAAVACGKSETPAAKVDPLEARCVEWGVAHYKEIDSYPVLTNGTRAADEAAARCKTSIDAYPNPGIAETQRAIKTIDAKISEVADVVVGSDGRKEAERDHAAAKQEWNALRKEREALAARLTQMRAEAPP